MYLGFIGNGKMWRCGAGHYSLLGSEKIAKAAPAFGEISIFAHRPKAHSNAVSLSPGVSVNSDQWFIGNYKCLMIMMLLVRAVLYSKRIFRTKWLLGM